MKKRKAQEQKLADDARLLRTCCEWHREQLAEALAGILSDVMKHLMAQLEGRSQFPICVGNVTGRTTSNPNETE
jgi:hypothetical protein